jgi:glycosyltransferase involved in cell wall biosynthesis
MRKKKILFVSEASWLSTGYSVYTKEVLSRLNQIDDFEVAELSCYVDRNDQRAKSVPWKTYPNKPVKEDASYHLYKGNPVAQFGDLSFNHVALDFQPDIVMDIRDWWMMEFEQRSPFRNFFHWAIMPTVDASPQNPQWINTYNSADSVFAYSEFGRDTMASQCKDIKFIDVASPAASATFSPVEDKRSHKEQMGLSKDSIIIGTVMRNQKRKLYPDLLASFKKFLDKSDLNNVYLYCHTYYPDVGWELPQLIQDHELASRVLMTYKCKNCNHISVDFFQNSVQVCNKCRSFTNQVVGINNPIDEVELSKIYNLFDVYVQYANSEGFGMPQLEAAHCGLPVISTYYSAMESVIDNIGGIGIEPISYYKECETGCDRAVPNNDLFVQTLENLMAEYKKDPSYLLNLGKEVRERAVSHYTWDKAADVWAKRFHQVELRDISETWMSTPDIKQPQKGYPNHLKNPIDITNFLFNSVLCKPEWIGNHIWKRMLKDLTFGFKCENMGKDFYFNESHVKSQGSNVPFSPKDALEEMINFRNQINQWEEARLNIIKKRMGNE